MCAPIPAPIPLATTSAAGRRNAADGARRPAASSQWKTAVTLLRFQALSCLHRLGIGIVIWDCEVGSFHALVVFNSLLLALRECSRLICSSCVVLALVLRSFVVCYGRAEVLVAPHGASSARPPHV